MKFSASSKSSVAGKLGRALVASWLAASVVACTGTVGSGAGAGSSTGSRGGNGNPGATGGAGTTTSGSGGGSGAGTGGAPGSTSGTGGNGVVTGSGGGGVITGNGGATAVTESAGPLPMRRLTHREFNHTLQDLLGDTTNIADTWGVTDDISVTGFQAPNSLESVTLGYIETAAGTVADSALAQNRLPIPCTNPAAGTAETNCAKDFITTFGRRAYRRPITDAEATTLLAVFTAAHTAPISYDFKTSIAQVVKAMLQSPNFLYHWELGPVAPVKQGDLVALTPYQLASRLSYLLWESMPDDALLDAAQGGQLQTVDQLVAQAQRMLSPKTATERARVENALYNFHRQWLEYPNLENLQKDPKVYPQFTTDFRDALPAEITSFVSSVLVDGDGTLTTLLTAPYAFVNAATASAYGVTATGTTMTRVSLNASQRSGLLTQAAFLAANGKEGGSFPIYRGLAVYRELLCGQVQPFVGMLPDLPPIDSTTIKTTRDQYAAHDSAPCAVCHKDFDPLGFAFENYDGVGAYRTTENGVQVDATGQTVTPVLKTAYSYDNAVQLMGLLSKDDEVKTCVGRKWFRYALGRMELPADEGSIRLAVEQARANPDFSVRDLLLGIVKSMTFRLRQPGAGENI